MNIFKYEEMFLNNTKEKDKEIYRLVDILRDLVTDIQEEALQSNLFLKVEKDSKDKNNYDFLDDTKYKIIDDDYYFKYFNFKTIIDKEVNYIEILCDQNEVSTEFITMSIDETSITNIIYSNLDKYNSEKESYNGNDTIIVEVPLNVFLKYYEGIFDSSLGIITEEIERIINCNANTFINANISEILKKHMSKLNVASKKIIK